MSWRVQVFGGVPPTPAQMAHAPIEFGTPEIALGDDGERDGPLIPLVYSPVHLETRSSGSVSMWGNAAADGSNRALHVMENVWHVFFEMGDFIIEGVEARDDGVLVHSRWEVSPARSSAEDEALIREVFGKL